MVLPYQYCFSKANCIAIVLFRQQKLEFTNIYAKPIQYIALNKNNINRVDMLCKNIPYKNRVIFCFNGVYKWPSTSVITVDISNDQVQGKSDFQADSVLLQFCVLYITIPYSLKTCCHVYCIESLLTSLSRITTRFGYVSRGLNKR